LRKYFAAVDKAQFHSLPDSQDLGEDDGDQVIPWPRPLSSLDSRIVNELNRTSILFHSGDLKGSRQFECDRPLATLPHFQLQERVGVDSSGRGYFRADLIVGYNDGIRFPAFANACIYC